MSLNEYAPQAQQDPVNPISLQQAEYLRERGYDGIVDQINIYVSRSKANYGKPYFGFLDNGVRVFIAWLGGEVMHFEDWHRMRQSQTDPQSKQIQDLQLNQSKLYNEISALKTQVNILSAAFGRK
jgi:hypothetical protein